MIENEAIERMKFSLAGGPLYAYSPIIKQSCKIINNYFSDRSGNNKLCLVYPSKDYVAQWLSLPLVLNQIRSDFVANASDVYGAYKQYDRGQKLYLNNKAIVQWVSGNERNFTFLTAGTRSRVHPEQNTQGDVITIKTERINSLRKAPNDRRLSSKKMVYKHLTPQSEHPLDTLLSISSNGNMAFLKSRVYLVNKYTAFDASTQGLKVNGDPLVKLFDVGKVNESGLVTGGLPLILSNDFSKIQLALSNEPIASVIMVDGFDSLAPLGDFSDVDRQLKVPVILISELSEVDSFAAIKDHGFDFYNFADEKLTVDLPINGSPFGRFDKKILKHANFSIVTNICHDAGITALAADVHAIRADESEEALEKIRVSLIRTINWISHLCHSPGPDEIADIATKVEEARLLYMKHRSWLGEAAQLVENAIAKINELLNRIGKGEETEKQRQLAKLLEKRFEYIICPTEQEKAALQVRTLNSKTKVIAASEVTTSLLREARTTAVLTGWPKWTRMNEIMTSFVLDELVLLLYSHEYGYFRSLQKTNSKHYANGRTTITDHLTEVSKSLFDPVSPDTKEVIADVVDFELRLDKGIFARYTTNGNMADTCKAKRIDFENDAFIFAADSHKFLVLGKHEQSEKLINVTYRRFESVQVGDIIALIDTDKDVLAKVVQSITRIDEYAAVKNSTDLWKRLLREHFKSSGSDFPRLVEQLRAHDCKKHPTTIRSWLQDDNRIGPDDDADLICIALLTGSTALYDSIKQTRLAISQMTGWRMRAADIVRDKIRNQFEERSKDSAIGSTFHIPELGSVSILRISNISRVTEDVDRRFVHRLLQKN